jgi:2,4-dienoyl-CoA reductase-like NADH-dependent reductase (Old Yellow Enzyme family)
MSQLKKLFSPIKIGKMEVKNRIAMAPITPNWSSDDGTVSIISRPAQQAAWG